MIVDEQDYVFTAASRSTDAPDVPEPGSLPSAPEPGQIAVTEPMLVLFSALTANPYRIHWDRDFCARAGHPGLVIHGPLQALWLAEEFARRGAEATGRTFSYRLTAPATAPAVMSVGEGDAAELVVRRPDRVVTATASLV
jgi:3-methylfumaryl-CoA hydratase